MSVAWRCLAALCAVGLTVDDRLTLQRYSASHGVVNDFSVCCTNLRGLCANHRFCGAQSRRLVQGRACTSYLCPLRANRIFFPKKAAAWYPQEQSVCCSKKMRVRTYAVAVASARTRYLHCCVSRLFVKSIEFLECDDNFFSIAFRSRRVTVTGVVVCMR